MILNPAKNFIGKISSHTFELHPIFEAFYPFVI
jgi:hypothetical protein